MSSSSPEDRHALIQQDLSFQTECGPRFPGSTCHQKVREWIIEEMRENHWIVETQIFTYKDITGVNIVGRYGSGRDLVILATHYDTRFTADRDPQVELRNQPVPGANDGASGVALLLHLAREIPKLSFSEEKEIWLVYFDLEDNGGYPGWDWILGSTAFVNSLTETPQAVVVVDMIGDRDLNLFYEHHSTLELSQEIWQTARQLGYEQYFRPQLKHRLIDDHLPFIERGFPASLLIDFDYPYWHTTLDTLDKVSAESLLIVSHTLLQWLGQ
ncbi:MAG: M28 family peptidase [Anaerolineales bacterium]|nr:M28 family peptidase [Anaerolineales bacterium]MDW8160891.1 M28 family peptidase [Anaerolineales bacterium]